MVRAKFKCQSNVDGMVVMTPVYSGSEENKAFWEYTPAGSITLTITNEAARDQFQPGEEYFVDFTPAAVNAQ
ncbi:hypothetical protein [Paenibacillus sp. DMB5]|uniref:hypothetical protein n=1 Tax=Paenibacillus sp. DMB5 TaxID=1780103 RepID=UPI00076C2E7F|nr:hypothetical protein [Paenibacillus sp. DMB5]KUP22419.1 hypothetical protein AWJ19_27780 [Paenibacillus sp. DMB5]